jgi:prevent-host-death family protein
MSAPARRIVVLLRCSTMATIPQRELRNETAAVLRRVEAGETLRITSNGRPVADLVPVERAATYVPLADVVGQIGGVLNADDRLDEELRALDLDAGDPFA